MSSKHVKHSTKHDESVGIAGLETLEQAAARHGVCLSTIQRRIAAGKLATLRVLGRVCVRTTEVDALDLVVGGGRGGRCRASSR